MKNPWSKAVDLLSIIFAIGIRAVVITTIIEIALILVALAVGVFVWISKDLITGLSAGLITFIFGQGLIVFILDLMFQMPDRVSDEASLPTDADVLHSLQAELIQPEPSIQAEQDEQDAS